MASDPVEFDYQGEVFIVRKLDTIRQFNIAKRLGPIVAELRTAFGDIMDGDTAVSGMNKALDRMAGPMIEAIAKLPDEASNYVIFHCLSAVRWRQKGTTGEAKIVHGTPDNMVVGVEVLQDLPGMMTAVWKVLEVHLLGFTSAMPLTSATTKEST